MSLKMVIVSNVHGFLYSLFFKDLLLVFCVIFTFVNNTLTWCLRLQPQVLVIHQCLPVCVSARTADVMAYGKDAKCCNGKPVVVDPTADSGVRSRKDFILATP